MENGRMLNGAKRGGAAYSVMMTAYLFVTLIGQTVLLAAAPNSAFIQSVISPLFSCVGLLVGVLFIKGNKRITDVCAFKAFNPVYVAVAVFLAAGMIFGLGFINVGIALLAEKLGVNIGGVSISLNTPLEYILSTVTLAITPALFEECFFRGGLQGELKGGSVFASGALVSIAFALYHCSLTQLAYQFIYGGMLFFLTYRARSVFPAIIAHFLNNFIILTSEFFKWEIDLFSPLLIVIGLVLLALAVTFLALYKNNSSDTDGGAKDKTESAIDFIIPYGILGFALCLVMVIAGALV